MKFSNNGRQVEDKITMMYLKATVFEMQRLHKEHGLKLIYALAERLNGKIERDFYRPGTHDTLDFPKPA
jgi:hypothetical protein